MTQEEFELSGIADTAGRVARVVPTGRIFVPGSIYLEGDSLRWSWPGKYRFVTPNKSMLDRFIRLWREPPRTILAFARNWGVLGAAYGNRPCVEGEQAGTESIEAWRYYSRRAMAVLDLIAANKQGKIGDVDDWKSIGVWDFRAAEIAHLSELAPKFPMSSHRARLPETARDAGHQITSELYEWMTFWRQGRRYPLSDFRIETTGGGAWEMQIDFHGWLVPAVAFQLCLVAVNAHGLFCCTACGWPYFRPRKTKRPKPGESNYCPRCIRAGIPARRASQRYRERKREGKADGHKKTRKR
jgi:hypothetical protein